MAIFTALVDIHDAMMDEEIPEGEMCAALDFILETDGAADIFADDDFDDEADEEDSAEVDEDDPV